MTKRNIIQSVLFSLAIVIIILVLFILFLYIVFVYNYNKASETRRKPISNPEAYSEFYYIKPTYERYKDNVNIHNISNDRVISFTIDIDDKADTDIWLGIVSGFAKDINKSSQPIIITFHSGINLPYYIEISNCEYIREDGKTVYTDSDDVCFACFKTNDGRYDLLDMIKELNVESIELDSGLIEGNMQEFVDTLNKTNTKNLTIWCHFYEEDADERKSEYQQALQTLLPNIKVFC